jgi:hypothetical protein
VLTHCVRALSDGRFAKLMKQPDRSMQRVSKRAALRSIDLVGRRGRGDSRRSRSHATGSRTWVGQAETDHQSDTPSGGRALQLHSGEANENQYPTASAPDLKPRPSRRLIRSRRLISVAVASDAK